MHEAARSLLVLGSTGCGKTHSGILPILDSLFGAGYGGVVFDVKGNLGTHVRYLAALHGREAEGCWSSNSAGVKAKRSWATLVCTLLNEHRHTFLPLPDTCRRDKKSLSLLLVRKKG